MPILPADAQARRIFMENLLDHSRAARLRGSFRLDDDPVANMNAHLRLAPSIRACRPVERLAPPVANRERAQRIVRPCREIARM